MAIRLHHLRMHEPTRDVGLVIEGRRACSSGRARSLRKSAGLSRRDFALVMDASEASIERWEKGTVQPRGKNAQEFALLLRQVEELIARAREREATEAAAGARA
jgi:DNA-binding transcriptional regulator YiaG